MLGKASENAANPATVRSRIDDNSLYFIARTVRF